MQAQLIPYEYVNKDSYVYFTVHFFGSMLRSREVSSAIFCIVEKTLHLLLYPFPGVHLGTRPLESRRQV